MAMNEKEMAEILLQMSGVNPRKCMQCGKCSASCPAYASMDIHPHQFVAKVRDGKIAPLLSSNAIYECLSCFACQERCPRDVKPAKLIEACRLMVIREQHMNRLKPEDIPCMLDEKLPQQAIVSAFRKYSK